MTLELRLRAAVEPHDLLRHPFYQAWSMGALTRTDLAGYAAQYHHQVQALPSLLRAAREVSADGTARAAIDRNLAEEEGREGPAHAALWSRFAAALDARPEEPLAQTRASADALRDLCREGEIEALAALWAYELQTARVARTKREGLTQRYGVNEVAFFALHEQLDVHHAADLLAALERACDGNAALERRACSAAARSAQAQWLFLDGAESRRSQAAA
jgi:pyrroloquinoline-quinone synthase